MNSCIRLFATSGRSRAPLVCVTAIALLAGCDGDERPFVEAVEVGRLNLARIAIEPPAGSVLEIDGEAVPLSVGVGERVALGIRALSGGSDEIELDASDRDWTVSDAAVLSIGTDGIVTGLSDGTAEVGLGIGGLSADPLTIAVSSAELATIASIDGPAAPEPCLAAVYTAVGSFDDGSSRRLVDVLWDVTQSGVQDATARLIPPGAGNDLDAGAIALRATDPDAPLTLIARASGVTGQRSLSAADTLDSLSFAPAAGPLAIDASRDLVVTAIYTRDDGASSVVLSDTLDWRVATGTDVASVDANGRVTALAAGAATIEASCGGRAPATTTVAVSAAGSDDDDDDGLVIEQGTTLTLAANGAQRQLRVSTGSDYDEDDDVTTEVTFTSDNVQVVDVVTSGVSAGLLTSGLAGEATVFARRDNVTVAIDVIVR